MHYAVICQRRRRNLALFGLGKHTKKKMIIIYVPSPAGTLFSGMLHTYPEYQKMQMIACLGPLTAKSKGIPICIGNIYPVTTINKDIPKAIMMILVL
jgi:hypothetical protein